MERSKYFYTALSKVILLMDKIGEGVSILGPEGATKAPVWCSQKYKRICTGAGFKLL
jgi:hypothetical protein